MGIYKFALFFVAFLLRGSYFNKVLKGAEIRLPQNEILFILPVKINIIKSICNNSRMLFFLKKSCRVYSILDGEIIESNNNIVIKHESLNRVILVKYYNISNILVKKGEFVTQGQALGESSNEYFEIEARLNDLIINILDYMDVSIKKLIPKLT